MPKPSVPILQLVFQHNQDFGSFECYQTWCYLIAGVAGVSILVPLASVDGLNGSPNINTINWWVFWQSTLGVAGCGSAGGCYSSGLSLELVLGVSDSAGVGAGTSG